MTIQWKSIIEKWKSSDYTSPVVDDETIDQLCELLGVVAKGVDKPKVILFGQPMMGETFEQLRADGYEDRVCIAEFLIQLKSHRKIWKVHSQNPKEDKTSHLFESFFIHPGVEFVRYIKLKFPKEGNPLKGPSNLKVIALDYHVSKLLIKIQE